MEPELVNKCLETFHSAKQGTLKKPPKQQQKSNHEKSKPGPDLQSRCIQQLSCW